MPKYPRPARLSLRRLVALAAAALIVAVTAEGCAGSAPSRPAAATPAATATPAPYASLQAAFTAAIKRVLPSVVEIRTSSGLGS